MRYRSLGRTGLSVSAVSLGTVSLGVDYGIAAPGAFGRPPEAAATTLLREAVDRGITLVDTAPTYGAAERLIGQVVERDPRVVIATKVAPPPASADVASAFRRTNDISRTDEIRRTLATSLDASRRALNRDVLDIVQIHNATTETIEDGSLTDALLDAKQHGIVRFLGATVYGEEAAMAVIRSGRFDVLQIAFNALDQRMAREVLPAAAAAGVGVIVRSAFLKGALTPKAQWLPDPLAAIRDAAERARDLLAGGDWERLPEAAMRFCLSVPHVGSVLTGARTIAELDAALAAEAAGPLDSDMVARASTLAIEDPELIDPSNARWASLK